MHTETRHSAAQRGPRATILLLILSITLSGCLTPSYLGIDNPYESDSTAIETYAFAYDIAVLYQLYPIVVITASAGKKNLSWDTVTTVAMPVAILSMVLLGTLLLPFAFMTEW